MNSFSVTYCRRVERDGGVVVPKSAQLVQFSTSSNESSVPLSATSEQAVTMKAVTSKTDPVFLTCFLGLCSFGVTNDYSIIPETSTTCFLERCAGKRGWL